jgi:branched-chain amino acid transport system ATP-binding protein
MTLLEVTNLRTRYGAIEALKGISLTVAEGEVVTLIGSNGAGKTTTLRSISGLTPASAGKIVFAGEEITRVPAHEIVGRGIALAPEGRHCFARMTVRENLDLGAHRRRGPEIAEDLARVYELFPQLKERTRQKAGTMSGGEQQMLAIGRALMANPRVLLMDEPSEGLAPQIIADVGRTIARLKGEGLSIVLVEQNIKLTLELADDIAIINSGRVVFTGAAGQIKINDPIVAQHLGVY